MDKNQKEGDEQTLNGLVDGELEAEQRRRILVRIREDADLREDACRLRHVKTLVHHAYAGARPPLRTMPVPQPWRFRPHMAAAAALLLGIGFTAGLLLPDSQERTRPEAVVASAESAAAPEREGVRISPTQTRHNKFVLHVSQGGPERFAAVMDRAERLLSSYPGPGLEIEVIANSEGLGLFREEVSTQVERIRHLTDQYDNIHFIACQNTMEVLQRQGVRTRLVSGTRTTQSAVDHIIDRLQDGWVYVRT
jgi:intracellular sulfur oxidation DsrE/DsrF family protein